MEDTFLYFGYGSSLNIALIEFRINGRVISLERGTLRNYALKFNRLNPDGSARANIIPSENDFTLGILYELPLSKFDLLSQTEPCYDLVEIEVETELGIKKAFTFICKKVVEHLYPLEKYLKIIIEGAELHHFPMSYIELIKEQAQPQTQSQVK